eukprot:CAMPEP_0185730746 /NCGR_PEP_ID=MMETSP1171-20130828/10898_1 /TAXON_ID=374046 /ORGANISM="Helicotheca tamensis, Strain CCMP826" /LENGTH=72 /DNA_ID=CAMNT_0028399869 /DNA_START=147 /DNA_END=361 /DNA_ORIENTATION=-
MSIPSILVSLFFLRYFAAQFPHGLAPSHLVFRARQRSHDAQSATVGAELPPLPDAPEVDELALAPPELLFMP